MANQELLKKFRDILRRQGLKYTPQRVAVFKEIIKDKQHRECEVIYLALRQKGSHVSRATVYRTMDILVKNDLRGRWKLGTDEPVMKARWAVHIMITLSVPPAEKLWNLLIRILKISKKRLPSIIILNSRGILISSLVSAENAAKNPKQPGAWRYGRYQAI